MKKHIVLLTIAAALIAVPSATFAQTNSAATSEAKPKHKNMDAIPYKGKIEALAADGSSITVGELKLNLTPETKILKNGEKAKLTDFAVGDKVTGSYKKDASGKLNAYSLHEGKKPGNGKKQKKTDVAK